MRFVSDFNSQGKIIKDLLPKEDETNFSHNLIILQEGETEIPLNKCNLEAISEEPIVKKQLKFKEDVVAPKGETEPGLANTPMKRGPGRSRLDSTGGRPRQEYN